MSNLFSLNWKDVGKGFLVAVLTVVITGLGTSLQSGKLPTLAELGALALAGLGAGLAYLLKNFFTNSNNELGKTEGK
jgi:Flp pilus assembly pilin Flp